VEASAAVATRLFSKTSLKRPEKRSSARFWMQEGIGVGKKTLANPAPAPKPPANIQRHVNHDGRSDDVAARDAAQKRLS